MKIKPVQCPNCGANVDLDLENLQKFCAQCGTKLMIDIENVEAILVAREKTRRTEMVEETKRMRILAEEKKRQEFEESKRVKILAEEKKNQDLERRKRNAIKANAIIILGWMVSIIVIAYLGYHQLLGMTKEFVWTTEFVLFILGVTYVYIMIIVTLHKKRKRVVGLGYFFAFIWVTVLIYLIIAMHFRFFNEPSLFGGFFVVWLFVLLGMVVVYFTKHPS